MSKVAELAYDIEQLYIEGFSPKAIATQLECPLELVYDWLESESLQENEEVSPFNTINS
jgi:DNA-directed RNA polymerase specialized sigma24 family protein